MKKRHSIIISISRSFFLMGDIDRWTNHQMGTENISFDFYGENHEFLPELQEGEHTPVVSLKQIVEAYKRGAFR